MFQNIHLPSNEQLALIGTVFGAAAVAYRKGIKPAWKWARKKVADFERISAALSPNGGSSISDKVASTHSAIMVAEQRQRAMLDSENHGVFESSPGGRWVFANRVFSRWTGRSAGELIGSGWVNIIHHEDRKVVETEWATAVLECRSFELTFRCIAGNGEPIKVSARANPVFDPATRQVLHYFGTMVRDERHMSQDEMEERIVSNEVRLRHFEEKMITDMKSVVSSLANLTKRLPVDPPPADKRGTL